MNRNTKSPILFLNPVLKQMVWGGSRLHEEFGYGPKADDIGECWAIAAHPKGDSSINCEKFHERFSGLTLSVLWKKEPKLFGNYNTEQFPLLIKIIDARSDLSIQVHPDDDYAAREEDGSLGKTECWYIIDCPEDAMLVVGHNARTKKELEDMVHKEKWDELIRKVPIKKGDFIQIDPGTVHAITAGCLILETQQNSDITYRLYDYGRKVAGKPRELHIGKSLDVIQVPAKSAEDSVMGTLDLPENQMNQLISCQYYTVYKLVVSGGYTVPHSEKFLNMSVLVGYDVEIAQKIAEKLGVEATFVEGEWDGLLAGLDSGRYDIMVNGVDITEERAAKYDFSTPYAYNRTAVIVSGDNEEIQSMEDLDGKHTANTISSTYAEVAEQYGAEVTGVDDLNQTFELLLSGRIDATLNAEVTYYDYMNAHPDANIKITALAPDATQAAIPVRKGAETATLLEAVNDALAELEASGELSALSEKYFGVDISKAE